MKYAVTIFAVFEVILGSGMAEPEQLTLDELILKLEQGPLPYNLSAWEADFRKQEASTYDIPPPQFMDGEDGLKLAYREWNPKEWTGRGDIYVIVPGSTSHSKHFGFLGSSLSTRGLLTRVIDFRGTGLSVCKGANDCGDPALYKSRVPEDDGKYFPGRIGDCADSDQLVRDLEDHLVDLRKKWPQARVHLSGHSSGGGLICRFAEYVGRNSQKNLADLVDSVVLLAPFIHWNYPANSDVNDRYSVVHVPSIQASIRGEKHRYVLGFNVASRRKLDPWIVGKWTQEMTSGMAAYSPDSFWQHFTVPTAYAIGAREELFDIEKARGEHAKAKNAGAFVVIEDASHLGIRYRKELADFMTDFVQNPMR
jgi:alpha-beta hydrolase superfamily lysophospholipase